MKYKVKAQSISDERTYTLERVDGTVFYVDIFTDGGLEPPKEYYAEEDSNKANEIFTKWLKSFVGKTLEIDEITPLLFSAIGKIRIIN
jgi:hypothetical protein